MEEKSEVKEEQVKEKNKINKNITLVILVLILIISVVYNISAIYTNITLNQKKGDIKKDITEYEKMLEEEDA